MRRFAPRLALVVLGPVLAALAAEGLARLGPDAAPTSSERELLWVAGARPVFVCGADGACRTDPGLVSLDNVDLRFPSVPARGTFRVICVGDSATAGWPYHPYGGYPEWLGRILAAALPGRRVEVLNFGIHAWDGARLERVFDEALSFRPDAVLVRTGYDDYPHFRLRHPRGGSLGEALQSARLLLLARSAAFRRLSRGFGPAPRLGIVAAPAETLTAGEDGTIVAEHRARLRAFAAKAEAAGARLVVLDLPDWPGFAPGFPGLGALTRQRAAWAEEARALGLPFAALDGLSPERFVDLVHPDLEGYRLTALAAARALAAEGRPEPAARWRFDRVPAPAALERALGLDDPEYRAHLEMRLARFFLLHRQRERAARHAETALLAAPNPDLVPAEVRVEGGPDVESVYREAFARLHKAGRVAEPTQAENRALAGL